MRFSIWPTATQSWDDLLEVAAYAAATGWDGVFVADHFMASGGPLETPMLECWSVLAALAAIVPRVRLGSLVSCNTYRHPAVLANIAASVDRVSGGRLVLGIGAGWQESEHHAYGIDLFDVATRLDRLDEACEVIRLLRDTPKASFSGRHYRLEDAPMEPKPAGPLPLLVGGGGERVTLRIVARHADEWNAWGTPEVIAAKAAVLARHCESVGRDPASIARSAQVIVDLDGSAPMPGARLPSIRAGTEEIQGLIDAYSEAGVGEFILPDWNLGRGARRREQLDRFLGEVAAPFRSAPPG